MLLPLMDFAQLALHHESLNASPFELFFGRQPRLTFDWRAAEKPTNARETLAQSEAKRMLSRIEESWTWAKKNLEKAQIKKLRDVNPHHRPSRKLGHQNVGPFIIRRKIGWSYELELPTSLKQVHPVFHAKLLRKDPQNPVPGQELPDPEEIFVIPGEQEFAVESIRAVKLVRRQLKYRANWLGCDEDPVYYPASNFIYSPHLLRKFHMEHQDLPGPPVNLPIWIQAYNDGRDDYSELQNDSAMDRRLRAAFINQGSTMTTRPRIKAGRNIT
ncbi:hypothetical protein K3495_g14527 [Podosphaera aphanis]|nr:hypothetical protein K3495_g14527 [Podosphaera aphanis]